MMASVRIFITRLLYLLAFPASLCILYLAVQFIAKNPILPECSIFRVCNHSFFLVDIDFLKNALTGLAGNIITIFTVSGISSLILYGVNAVKIKTIKSTFGLTKTNTRITILVSNVHISEQITGRLWRNRVRYPGYKGSSFVLNEYEAALSIKDIFKKKEFLFSWQGLLDFISSNSLKVSSINVEIISCPDNDSELKALIEDAVVNCTRSLIVLGSPVNNQLTEFIFFGEIKNQSISDELTQLREKLLRESNYQIRPNGDLRTIPICFTEELDDGLRIRIRDCRDREIMYKGILKSIPVEGNNRLKSTITILAGWDDKETKNIANYFIDNLGTIQHRKHRWESFLFRLDNGITYIK